MTARPSSQRQDAAPVPVARWVVATAIAGTVLIAVGAFWLSFTALADLAVRAGIAPGQAWVWPLIVDGIIVVATISVVALSPFGRRANRYPWALLIAGAAVSVSGNTAGALVADTELPAWWAAAISAVPPLVLLAITHLTVELARHTRTTDNPDRLRGVSSTAPAAGNSTSRRQRRDVAWARHRAGWTNVQIARHLGVHPSTVGRWLTGPPANPPAVPEPAADTASTPADRDPTDTLIATQGATHGS